MRNDKHKAFKRALMLEEKTIAEYAATLVKPDGTVGVSTTSVIRTAQGYEGIPWLIDEIDKTIAESRKKFSSYYRTIEGEKRKSATVQQP